MVTYPRCMTSTAKTSPGYIISKSIEMFRGFTVTQHLYLHSSLATFICCLFAL